MAAHKDDSNGLPRATLEDLHHQNEQIIGHLERLNQNLYYIREAIYGVTQAESKANARFDNPKHGEFGAITESSNEVQSQLAFIGDAIEHLEDKLDKR